MKKVYNLLVLILLLLTNDIYAGIIKPDTLAAEDLKPYGRYYYNSKRNLELISSAVHFGVQFKGTRCEIYASMPDKDAHGYLQYELDGVYQKRLRIDGDSPRPIIITAPKFGNHKIWIYKCTEATTGAIQISKIAAEYVTPLTVAEAPLIEFIGNSITCGAAADGGDTPCNIGDYVDHHNAYMAYGPRLSRTLGVNYILSSVSGIGIYRNWNSDGPTMPQVYEKIDFTESNLLKWDFSLYPKVVSIALGTNDFSDGDGKTPRLPFDASKFIAAYVNFIKTIYLKYPHTRIALLSSPMVKQTNGKILEDCINTVKNKINANYPDKKPIQVFFFPPMQAHGCAGHPSVRDHALMAKQATAFFKRLLK